MNSLTELIAQKQHDIWAHWMNYLFEVSDILPDGSCHIPSVYVQRWLRQIETSYSDLSEQEKNSDREQAQKITTCLEPFLSKNMRSES